MSTTMRYDTIERGDGEREGVEDEREIGGKRKRERDTQQNRERERRTAGVGGGGDERERFCGEMCRSSHMQGRTQFEHYFASRE
jgi:hypothetical protein